MLSNSCIRAFISKCFSSSVYWKLQTNVLDFLITQQNQSQNQIYGPKVAINHEPSKKKKSTFIYVSWEIITLVMYSTACRDTWLYSELSNVPIMRSQYWNSAHQSSDLRLRYGLERHSYSYTHRVEFPQNILSEGEIPVLFLCTMSILSLLLLPGNVL